MKIVVDINLLIDFSRSKKVKDSLWLNLLEYCKKEGHQLILSSIVVFEFFSGEEMNNQTNQEIAENLFNDVLILGFNEEIAKKAGKDYPKILLWLYSVI